MLLLRYLSLFLLLPGILNAQVTNTAVMDTTGGEKLGNLTIAGFIDTYFGYSFPEPRNRNLPYLVSSSRHNEFTLNLAYVDLRFQHERMRARFVPATGTYMNANYVNEQGLLRNVLEASIGVKLSAHRNIWVDAGVIGSPYTNESAISKDHLMYTRSLSAENVPYYLSGIKVTAPLRSNLTFYGYLLNGWQQIRDVNAQKSAGTQLEWKINPYNLVNWDTYVGDERSNSNNRFRMRYFTDIYWIHQPEGRWSTTACAYAGIQEVLDAAGTRQNRLWWQANLIGRYALSETVSVSGRLEYFSDPDAVIYTSPLSGGGMDLGSTGACLNIRITEHAMFRCEYRHFFSPQAVYRSSGSGYLQEWDWAVANLTAWF